MFTEWTGGLGDGWIDNISMHFPSALNDYLIITKTL